jgi:hypothetical protein
VRSALALVIAAIITPGLDAPPVPTPRTGPAAGAPGVRVVRYGDDRLSGITAVDVVAGDMRANTCGLSRGMLQETAIDGLRAAGMKASVSAKASSWFYTVYVTAESSAVDGRCVTAVTAELVARVDGIPEVDRNAPQDAWGSVLVGQMPLVRQSALVSSRRADHAARVASTLGEQVRAIGARIRAVNEPKPRP